MALLPPIPLYRRLLRAHRKHLPSEMRVLGDEYIKAEFRAHRTVDNPAHLVRSFPVVSQRGSPSFNLRALVHTRLLGHLYPQVHVYNRGQCLV